MSAAKDPSGRTLRRIALVLILLGVVGFLVASSQRGG